MCGRAGGEGQCARWWMGRNKVTTNDQGFVRGVWDILHLGVLLLPLFPAALDHCCAVISCFMSGSPHPSFFPFNPQPPTTHLQVA